MKRFEKLKKSFVAVSVILFASLFLSSCAKVKVKNSEFCGDMGARGASCFHTLSDDTRILTPGEWEEERFGMICSKPETFADWKASLMKLCKLAKWRCRYDVKKKVIEFSDKIENFKLQLH